MTSKVFISHSSRDKHVADAVCAHLENAGVRCWIAPRDIRPGASYGAEILKGIEDSSVLVIVLSACSNKSRHVCKEVERAISRGLTIIPFRIDGVVPCKDLEYFLSSEHWLDAMTPPLEQHLGKLVRSVTAHIGSLQEAAIPETAAQREQAIREFQEIAPDAWRMSGKRNGLLEWITSLLADR